MMMIQPSGEPECEDESGAITEINTTPLIDVLLVLLIMVMVTVPLQPQLIGLALPSASATRPEPPPPRVVIAIAAGGALTWEGEPLADAAALEQRLDALARLAEPPEIHLKPAPGSTYGAVAAVLAALQRRQLHKVGLVEPGPEPGPGPGPRSGPAPGAASAMPPQPAPPGSDGRSGRSG